MRIFRFENGNGDTIDVTSKEVFMHDVTGLGMEYENTYRRVGSRFILAASASKGENIQGNIAFMGDNPYKQFEDFAKRMVLGPICLLYDPYGSNINIDNETEIDEEGNTTTVYTTENFFRKKVAITKMSKGEINREGYLDVAIDLYPLTPWYKTVTTTFDPIVFSEDDNEAFDVLWDWEFGRSDSTNRILQVEINSDSTMESPCRLTILSNEGVTNNPNWFHYVNNRLVENGSVTCTLRKGWALAIDNRDNPHSITMFDGANDLDIENSNAIQDLYQNVDFTKDRFINIRKGKNTIIVTGSFPDPNKLPVIRAEVDLYYAAV